MLVSIASCFEDKQTLPNHCTIYTYFLFRSSPHPIFKFWDRGTVFLSACLSYLCWHLGNAVRATVIQGSTKPHKISWCPFDKIVKVWSLNLVKLTCWDCQVKCLLNNAGHNIYKVLNNHCGNKWKLRFWQKAGMAAQILTKQTKNDTVINFR